MKMTKGKWWVVLGVLLAAALAVSAGEDKMAKLKAELNLSDAQVNQLKAEFSKLQPLSDRVMALKKELEALEGAASPDQRAIEAKKAEVLAAKKQAKEKYNAVYRSVLNAEQWAKLEAMYSQGKKGEHARKD